MIAFAVFCLAIIAYCLPWIVGPASSLTLNAYDLAEWTSLHPLSRAAVPPLLASLALRSLPMLLLFLLATAPGLSRFSVPLGGIIALGFVPPLEFFGPASGDANFRQQFGLALLTVLGTILIASGRICRFELLLHRYLRWLPGLVGIFALVTSYELMRSFAIGFSIGAGSVIFVGLALLYAGLSVINKRGGLTP